MSSYYLQKLINVTQDREEIKQESQFARPRKTFKANVYAQSSISLQDASLGSLSRQRDKELSLKNRPSNKDELLPVAVSPSNSKKAISEPVPKKDVKSAIGKHPPESHYLDSHYDRLSRGPNSRESASKGSSKSCYLTTSAPLSDCGAKGGVHSSYTEGDYSGIESKPKTVPPDDQQKDTGVIDKFSKWFMRLGH